jgi:hypothetical protein
MSGSRWTPPNRIRTDPAPTHAHHNPNGHQPHNNQRVSGAARPSCNSSLCLHVLISCSCEVIKTRSVCLLLCDNTTCTDTWLVFLAAETLALQSVSGQCKGEHCTQGW